MLDRAELTRLVQTRLDAILVASVIRFLPRWLKPNHLTFLRLILVVPLILLLALGSYWWSLVLFVFLSLLDLVDGAMARTRDERSNLGRALDPIADKVLVGATILLIRPPQAGWTAVIVALLSVELLIVVSGTVAKLMGSNPEANIFGKLKMNLQVLAVILLMVGIGSNAQGLVDASLFVFYLTLPFALLSVIASKSYLRHVGRPLTLLRKRRHERTVIASNETRGERS